MALGLTEKVQFVEFPKKNAHLKVIQIYVKEIPFLVCGGDHMNHSSILEDFLKSRNIEFKIIPLNRMVSGPEPIKEGLYRTVGMGYAIVYPDDLWFTLPHNKSMTYGIGASKEFNDLIRKTLLEQNSKWNFIDMDD